MILNIDFSPGKITFDDLNIKIDIPLKNQVDSLKEDLLQVNYADEYIIDIGWYPEFDENGSFKIQVIEGFDWSNPKLIKQTRSIKKVIESLVECAEYIKKRI